MYTKLVTNYLDRTLRIIQYWRAYELSLCDFVCVYFLDLDMHIM